MDQQQTTAEAQVDAQANRDIAALGYVWILSVIVYFAKKQSPFVRFHARQGMVLFILSLLLWPIPILGQFLELIVLAFAVLGFLAAAQGQWKDLPVIGPLAKRDMVGVRANWRSLLESLLHGWREVKKDVMKNTPSQTASATPSTPTPAAPVAPPAAPAVSSMPPSPRAPSPPAPPSPPHP